MTDRDRTVTGRASATLPGMKATASGTVDPGNHWRDHLDKIWKAVEITLKVKRAVEDFSDVWEWIEKYRELLFARQPKEVRT